jgi:hypothetical protein
VENLLNFSRMERFVKSSFLPRREGSNLRLRALRKTTTYWGWLQPPKSYDFVPNPKPPKLPELLHE